MLASLPRSDQQSGPDPRLNIERISAGCSPCRNTNVRTCAMNGTANMHMTSAATTTSTYTSLLVRAPRIPSRAKTMLRTKTKATTAVCTTSAFDPIIHYLFRRNQVLCAIAAANTAIASAMVSGRFQAVISSKVVSLSFHAHGSCIPILFSAEGNCRQKPLPKPPCWPKSRTAPSCLR